MNLTRWVEDIQGDYVYLVTWINEQWEDTVETFHTREDAEKFFEKEAPNCYNIYRATKIK